MGACLAQRGRQAQMDAPMSCCWLAPSSENLPNPVPEYYRWRSARALMAWSRAWS